LIEGRRDAMKAYSERLPKLLCVPDKSIEELCAELRAELLAGRDEYSLALVWQLIYHLGAGRKAWDDALTALAPAGTIAAAGQ
jgi:hypothetical protein